MKDDDDCLKNRIALYDSKPKVRPKEMKHINECNTDTREAHRRSAYRSWEAQSPGCYSTTSSSSSSSRLCPSTAGCSPPSILPLSSVAFLIHVVPSFSVMSSCHLLLGRPLDLFPLLGCHCAAFGPPIVLHSCYMTGPFPLLFQCVFYDINYLGAPRRTFELKVNVQRAACGE